jgi:hypothetical protein
LDRPNYDSFAEFFGNDEIESFISPGEVDIPTFVSQYPGDIHFCKVISGLWSVIHYLLVERCWVSDFLPATGKKYAQPAGWALFIFAFLRCLP